MRLNILLGGLLAALVVPAAAQTPAVDLAGWKTRIAGPPSHVLTLGSPHLAQLPVTVTADMLAPLLEKLARFAPQVITYEGLAGEQCEHLQRYAATYVGVFDGYCRGTEEAAKATGLSVTQATSEADALLANWTAHPTAAQRRRLAALYLAAGERPSAQVQWLQLPLEERTAGDGIDEALLKILERAGAKPNETFEVAVALAVSLGLQRIHAVDDHTADVVQTRAGAGFEEAMQRHWQSMKVPLGDSIRAKEKSLANGADLLALYRAYNQPATLRAFVEADFRDALKEPSPQGFGRQYVAWYEVRNLRMVANIRAAFANRPGARVLNIVGASHKAYYDSYLGRMSEVQLVDADTVLR